MKYILLICLVCLNFNSFSQSIEVKKSNNRYDVYKGDTLLGTLKHKKFFPRFELSFCAGESFYGQPNSEKQILINSGHNYAISTSGGHSFQYLASASVFIIKHIDIGFVYSKTDFYYSATTKNGYKFRGSYVDPSINYGGFADYYFHFNKFSPFAGISVSYQQDHFNVSPSFNKYYYDGSCIGLQVGLKYEVLRHLFVFVTEYINQSKCSFDDMSITSFSTMGGVSFRF